ncbi:MAG TPA: precorrin-6A synthase (deacetylating) [Nitrospiraceae bacterium]|nr:precorrin-6A synthase (deacetylating) [Nitrospiraceae bacterium]
MKKIYLIGIGPGDSDYLTVQAINTMKKVNVFFLLEKEGGKNEELIKIREEILIRYLSEGTYRIVTAKIPERKKGGKTYEVYKEKVETWRQQKAEIIAQLIKNEMEDGEIGAFLIWGDPALYDGHLEILQHILKGRIINFEYEVIPGITSVQVLTAKHKIPLNRIGESIVITTGRRLKECLPAEISNTVVLLDTYSAFKHFKDEDLDIYWGGYLGSKDEILLSGKLKDVIDDLKKTISETKKKKGWLMDTYILRRSESSE